MRPRLSWTSLLIFVALIAVAQESFHTGSSISDREKAGMLLLGLDTCGI